MPTAAQRRSALAARAVLLRRQRAFANAMLTRYLPLEAKLVAQAKTVVDKIVKLRSGGLEPGVALESERERVTALLDDTREQIQRWADEETRLLEAEGPIAARLGAEESAKQVNMTGTFGRQNAAALERLVQRFETLPVSRRHLDAGADAKEAVKQALFEAVGRGDNPRKAVAAIKEALGSTKDHADTIARTWIVDANRGAGLDYYRSQSDRIKGWEWLCAKNERTCPLCLAMDGTRHKLDEPFASHPRCRCTHMPLLEDEFAETPQQTGQEYYDALDEQAKRDLVGPVKARLIADGKIGLGDLVHDYVDPTYGPSRSVKTVKQLLAEGRISRPDFSSAWARRNEAATGDKTVPMLAKADDDSADWTERTSRLYGGEKKWDASGARGLEHVESIMGRPMTPEQICEMLGAPHGCRVSIGARPNSVSCDVILQDGSLLMSRTIRRGDNGPKVYHESFDIAKDEKNLVRRGDGAVIFAKSIEGYRKYGVALVETSAAGGPYSANTNGYYTWARFGFEGKMIPATREAALKDLGIDSDKISDVMRHPQGAAWWKKNGHSFNGEFDLADGSTSVKVLEEYVSRRRKPAAPEPVAAPKAEDGPDWTARTERLYGKPPASVKFFDNVPKGEPSVYSELGMTPEALAQLVGAPAGSHVIVSSFREQTPGLEKLAVSLRQDGFQMVRIITRDRDNPGKFIIEHEIFAIKNDPRSIVQKGDGAIVFSRAVENYRADGRFSRIDTQAEGSLGNATFNGYYTWARFGFDGEAFYGRRAPQRIAEAKALFGSTRISDIMKHKDGPAWWKENGETFKGEFDLTEGSTSLKVIDSYVANRRKT